MPPGCLLLKILNMFYIKQGRTFVLMYGKDVSLEVVVFVFFLIGIHFMQD